MFDTTLILASAWQWISGLTNAINLQLLLLMGSGLLAVALLVLSLTKWGHARPVWKCVVLSVAAHILLIGYAYGTHLIFRAPAVAETEPVRINLIEDENEEEDEDLQQLRAESEPQLPWNEFAHPQHLPDVEELKRPSVDSQVVLERTVVEPETDFDSKNMTEFDSPSLQTTSNAIEPFDDTSFVITDSVVAAQENELPRREIKTQPTDKIPELESTPDLKRPEISAKDSVPINHDFNPAQDHVDVQGPFRGELIDESPSSLPITQQALNLASPTTNWSGDSNKHEIAQPPIPMKLTSSQHRLGDGKPLPDLYKLRAAESRLMEAERRGGSIETEQAVQAALKWLADNQQADGHWDPKLTQAGRETKVFGHDRQGAGADADTGITALAVIAFMAGGNSHLEGNYQLNVQKGLEFLLRNQAVDGNLAGNARLFARTYCHSMSLLALSEALAITGDARLTAAVQRGVEYSVYAQNRTDGGWRYQPGDRGDMSQFGWQVLAMHSAAAGGIHVPMDTIDRMKAFLNSCTSGVGNGLASYRPNQGVSTTMTAEALVCRFFLSEDVGKDTQQQATTQLLRELPSRHHVNLYYWYYGTMAMFQVGGQAWEEWNQSLKTALLTEQVTEGSEAGSWAPNGLWAGYGGRVYSTAMATLCLEVYYRYLPMYEVAEAEAARMQEFQRQSGRIIQLR